MIANENIHYYSARPELKLAFTQAGTGEETLLFLHGMGSSLKAWSKNIEVLKTKYNCIALDLPGYGLSDPLDQVYSMPVVASIVVDFIKAQGLGKVVLVGHSMGGLISMELYCQQPELVSQMVLIAPAGLEVFSDGEIEMIGQYFTSELLISYPKAMIKKNFELNFYNMPADARFMIEDRYQLAEDPPRYQRFCQTVAESTLAIINHNMMDKLEGMHVPVHVIFAEDDNLIPHHLVHPDMTIATIASKVMARLPQGELTLLKDCGHFVQWEKSVEINNYLLALG